MTVAVATVAGAVVAWLLWRGLRPSLSTPVFLRENHRGAPVPTAVGVIIPLTAVALAGGRVAAEAAGAEPGLGADRVAVLVAVVGFGLLGLLDDLGGDASSRGFRGHLGALARGRLTTGGVKLLGGGAVAFVAAGVVGGGDAGWHLVVDAAVVALAANLANLFDRAPGRTTKVGALAFVVLAVATAAPTVLSGVAVVVGASWALLADDLRERLMLGDAGANALGGALGVAVVASCSPGVRVVVLAGLAAANLLSEVVSFSRVIDAVPPLRALDRAGRLRS